MSGLALSNVLSRRSVGLFLERTVFSSPGLTILQLHDQPTRHVPLTEENFRSRSSVLHHSILVGTRARHSRRHTWCPLGWWLGRLPPALALCLHEIRGWFCTRISKSRSFPGWLDKTLKWRHAATPALSNMILLAPNPDWVATLPGGKLPDQTDFTALTVHERIPQMDTSRGPQ